MIVLARISVTPLKGTVLHHPSEVELTTEGIPGNRRFFLVDARGRLFSGGDHGPLVRIRADWDPGSSTLCLSIPDRPPVSGRIDGPGEPITVDFYGRPVAGRLVADGLGDAISSHIGQAVRLVLTDREGSASDVHRLSLVSWSSVRDLGARNGRPHLDSRRFRMDLELDGCEPFEEETWEDMELEIGEAHVRVLGRIPRCVVTTHDPATGRKDFDTLKRIAEYRPLIASPRGVGFGMYAEVIRPGKIRVGDPVLVRVPDPPRRTGTADRIDATAQASPVDS